MSYSYRPTPLSTKSTESTDCTVFKRLSSLSTLSTGYSPAGHVSGGRAGNTTPPQALGTVRGISRTGHARVEKKLAAKFVAR